MHLHARACTHVKMEDFPNPSVFLSPPSHEFLAKTVFTTSSNNSNTNLQSCTGNAPQSKTTSFSYPNRHFLFLSLHSSPPAFVGLLQREEIEEFDRLEWTRVNESCDSPIKQAREAFCQVLVEEADSRPMSYMSLEGTCEHKKIDLTTESITRSTSTQPDDPKQEQTAKHAVNLTHNLPCGPEHMDQIPKSYANSDGNPCPVPTPRMPTADSNSTSKQDLVEKAANSATNPNMFPNSELPIARPKGAAAATLSSTTASDPKGIPPVSNFDRGTGNATRSDSTESSSGHLRPHTGGDGHWDAINLASSRDPPLGLSHFRLLKRLGYGDIGSVYLVELRGTSTYFAMKVMDKGSLASRNKLLRAQTEREILCLLDHPFLPTLYSYFETDKFYCLVMEFCSGGNLHTLRQKQPNKYFTEEAARFYASEVLLALEYLHMLGIVYRDLKPENVLVRDQGHIMLSDFDLSLRCSVSPTLVKSSSVHVGNGGGGILDEENTVHGCTQPSTFLPRILPSKKNRKSKSDFGLLGGGSLPELMAEPTNVRSMSFVGTHEYLAPEIIRGEGHGSAVDWWTFGIFLYELLHGTTPFKGAGNRATLFNVVGQPLRFPESPQASSTARDLIKGLLVKEPQKRIAYKRGATEIKQHPFFEGVNWALVRSAMPPHIPDPVDFGRFASKETGQGDKKMTDIGAANNPHVNQNSSDDSSYVDFEYF